MADVEGALPIAERVELRNTLAKTKDAFISALPKIELHIHIAGIITPEVKWKFSQRNGQVLKHPRTGAVISTLDELKESHGQGGSSDGDRQTNTEETLSFFESLYAGLDVLKTEQDYHDLAMDYFEHAAAMNIRYCEVFFNPQGHTQRGTKWETMMEGFHKAQKTAERDLNVRGG